MDKYLKTNLDLWNEWTPIHEKSEFYDVEGFKAGRCTLHSTELKELGDVSGKSLLHLQCHFGMDTMSWARLGAKVTGVDFSDRAIALAKSLSQELSIEANFICSNIQDLPEVLKGEFDIVFTSYGVLPWLPDINRWAKVIAHFLKLGGVFYIIEGHPFTSVFENESYTKDFKLQHSYFYSPHPTKYEPEGSYADRKAEVVNPSYEWTHSLSDIINALIVVGLRIEFLHEFPFCHYDVFPFLGQGKDKKWRLKGNKEIVPLMFSLKATK
ncbi:MAG: class I SAM-dependent methyltransferase [Candidatus Zixiibacteriota bacterium]